MDYKIYTSAAEVLNERPRGAVTMRCTLAEAQKLIGEPTENCDGHQGVYSGPIAYEPFQNPEDPREIWNVGVSLDAYWRRR